MRKYLWSDGQIPTLDNHSKCKHEIIRDYLTKYLEIVSQPLNRFPNRSLKITIVDGFAGGGKYQYQDNIVDGSPLILLNTVAEAKAGIRSLNPKTPIQFEEDFIFVEKNQQTAQYLQGEIRKEGFQNKSQVLCGEFGHYLPTIIAQIKKKSNNRQDGRSIFILDQYGYSDVLIKQIKCILNNSNAEIILTFAVDALITYLDESKQNALSRIGFSQKDFQQFRRNQSNRDKCRSIIQHRMSSIFYGLNYFFTPFFIISDNSKSQGGYWLIHISRHYRARQEMVGLHWDKGNISQHYGTSGINMLGYRSKFDEDYTKQLTLPHSSFRFDVAASQQTHEALHREIGNYLYKNIQSGSAITVKKLKQGITNHTPGSDQDIQKALDSLKEEKSITIKGNANSDKRIITVERQLVIKMG